MFTPHFEQIFKKLPPHSQRWVDQIW